MSNGPQDVLRILEALHTLFVRTGDCSVAEAIELAIRAVTEMCFDSSPNNHALLRAPVRSDYVSPPVYPRKSPVIREGEAERCLDGVPSEQRSRDR